MNWKYRIRKPEAGTPLNWEIYFPPGLATWASERIDSLLAEIKLPNQPLPKLRTFTEKIKLENANSHQIAYLFQYAHFIKDIRLVLGKTEDWNHYASEAQSESQRIIEASVPLARSIFPKSDSFLHSEILSFLHGSYYENEITVTLSLFGEPAYIRGVKGQFASSAPVPEDLTSAMIQYGLEFAGWETNPQSIVYLPFAGTGTFATEWEIHVRKLPSLSLKRKFVFPNLQIFPEKTITHFEKTIQQKSETDKSGLQKIFWKDTDPALSTYWSKEKSNWKDIFKEDPNWEFSIEDFFQPKVPLGSLLKEIHKNEPISVFLPLNPPYGFRKKEISNDDANLYPKIGSTLSRLGDEFLSTNRSIVGKFSGFLLCPSEEKWMEVRNSLKKFSQKTIHVTHGGIDLRVLFFDLKK
ncbi:hypothetical protein [Leptospira ilyithenensis]|uniref:Uncharacterized protein n=1 Tax=Leptospira ilyithenensis TaxID=2484901 RepID=A0A4R9LTQ0_9LEPT|nr:hypothetical protein [Leptospira ilyithenensis]TGN10543.1 hypothetical protein EHS11_09660 [Leptospira ilyithenensis]